MKKLIPLIVSILLAGCQSNLVKPALEEIPLTPIANSSEYLSEKKLTPKEISRRLGFIDYKEDNQVHGCREFFQSPAMTMRLGTGDCEDTATLGAGLAESIGYAPQRLIFKGRLLENDEPVKHCLTYLEEQTPTGMEYGVIGRNTHVLNQKSIEDALAGMTNKDKLIIDKFWVEDLREIYDKNGINWRITDENLFPYEGSNKPQ